MLLSTASDSGYQIRPLLDLGAKIVERVHLGHQHGGWHGVHSRLLLLLASGYGDLYELDVQQQLLERAEALVLAGREYDLLPEVRCALADSRRRHGEYNTAWADLERVAPLLEKSQDPRQRAACLVVRANLGVETTRAHESVQAAQQALQLLAARNTRHTMLYYRARGALNMALAASGQRRQAVDAYERTIEEMDASGLEGTRPRMEMRFQLALGLLELGRRREAHEILHEVIERSERWNDQGRLQWQFAIYYAETSLQQGDVDTAVRYFDRITRQAVADDDLYWEGRGQLRPRARTVAPRRGRACATRGRPPA